MACRCTSPHFPASALQHPACKTFLSPRQLLRLRVRLLNERNLHDILYVSAFHFRSFLIWDSTLETFSGITVASIRPQRPSPSNTLEPNMNSFSFSFSSRWHPSAQKGPYALRPVSQQSPRGCPRNRANICLVEHGTFPTLEGGMSTTTTTTTTKDISAGRRP